MKARITMALQLFWCALMHGMTRYSGTYRCMRCNPVAKRRKPANADQRELDLVELERNAREEA